jgi:5-formaminoimidazole-4-carboxamide-1-beta-D-ribofuranosyl 5'-monophosphate synthetase
MLGQRQTLSEAATRLGVVVPEASFGGYTVYEWEEDFKLRISILKWEEKKRKLEETEKKLSALVSEEARTEMELEKIAKSLGV